jgi:hypothetical protein
MIQKLFLVQLPDEILMISSVTISEVTGTKFRLKNLIYNHSLNKTKQPFSNLLQCFRVKDNLRKNSKKYFKNLTLGDAK